MAENSAPPDFDEADTDPVFSARHVSIKRLSELTGFDRNTISGWIKKGCPVVSAGERGTDYVLDIRAVWKWREREVAKAVGSGSTDEAESGVEFMGQRDMDRALKMATIAGKILDVADKQKKLVPVEAASAAFARALARVRQTVMAIPENVARDLSGFPEDAVANARRSMIESCRSALDEGHQDLKKLIDRR